MIDMTTQSLTRCFRFPNVDFEPDVHLLVWRDKTETPLTLHESRLLEALCYCAGEVISHEHLHNKTFSQLDPYEDSGNHHYDLNTVLKPLMLKLDQHGKMANRNRSGSPLWLQGAIAGKNVSSGS